MNTIHTTSPEALSLALASSSPPLLLDVRREAARHKSGRQIPGTQWCDPALWLDWKDVASRMIA